MSEIENNKQWKEIVFLLDIMEETLNRLYIYGVYKRHDFKVINNRVNKLEELDK